MLIRNQKRIEVFLQVQIASLNVRVNATGVKNRELSEKWLEELDTFERAIEATSEEILTITAERGGF